MSYTSRGGRTARRLLLPKSRNHVYFEVDEASGLIVVLAVWGAPRAKGPKL